MGGGGSGASWMGITGAIVKKGNGGKKKDDED